MEAGPHLHRETPPRRASEWLAALLERPDDAALRKRFDAWLAADPAHAADWSEMARTYEAVGRARPAHHAEWAGWVAKRHSFRHLPDVAGAGPAGARPHGERPVRYWRRAAIGLVAASFFIAVVGMAFPEARWLLTADHVTTIAEVSTLRLPDGSTVRLGPLSALDVDFAGDARGVRLLHGEAFFEVVRDPARPFRVQADDLDATVLGTAFEVSLDAQGAEVAVRQGKVRVSSRHESSAKSETPKSETLGVGDWARATDGGELTRGTQPPTQVAAWVQHRLIVKDRPVSEVVDALRRYYRGVVILLGDALAAKPLTGTYDLSDPVGALKAVASALGAEAHQVSPWVFIVSGS
jgi:transmembrane sensor